MTQDARAVEALEKIASQLEQMMIFFRRLEEGMSAIPFQEKKAEQR